MSRREQDAAAWFARMRGPDAERHRAAFEAWRSDPENARAYADAEEDWLIAGSVAPVDTGPRPALRAAWRPVRSHWAMAAALLLTLTLGLSWYWQISPHSPQLADKGARPDMVRLADGSDVLLMDGARIDTRFSGNARRVILIGGHARFIVAHDSSRPFTVVANGSETTALGTIFEVDVRQRHPRIHLIKGSVEVRAPGGTAVRLAPGESAEVDGPEAHRIPVLASPVTTTMLEADTLPLGAVIERANRSNKNIIRLADPALATRQVTGRFDTADGALLARKLAAALDLDLVDQPDGFLLRSKLKKAGG